ncbi:MAG: DNA polymerase III subunit delta' [Pseudomonadota bacterium]
MADENDIAEPLHPRLSTRLIGQQAAEKHLLEAYLSGKMHHAWILGGPPGIGKATLAYRMAKFVLANPDPQAMLVPPDSLEVDPDDPVARRVVAQGHADLLTVTPAWDQRNKRYKTEISVTEARRASEFFARTAGEGGWRVCIVDPAGSMNAAAANALLKILEEPPEKALFLLVTDVPGRLLRTIRSRCVRLDLRALDAPDVKSVLEGLRDRDPELDLSAAATVTQYADGSPGRALQILKEGGFKSFETFLQMAGRLPQLDRKAALRLAQQLSGRGAASEFAQFCDLMLAWLSQHIADAARKAGQTGATPVVQNPAVWAEAHDEISRSLRRANALNLDRQNTVLSVLNTLAKAAAVPPPAAGIARPA